jgi:acyl-CoA dehydrogenase
MTASSIGAAAVDPALVDMMDAVIADHRETHPPAGNVQRDPELWRRLDDLGWCG